MKQVLLYICVCGLLTITQAFQYYHSLLLPVPSTSFSTRTNLLNNIHSIPNPPYYHSITSHSNLQCKPSHNDQSPSSPWRLNSDYLLLNFVAILFGTQHSLIKISIDNYQSSAILNFWRFTLSTLLFSPSLNTLVTTTTNNNTVTRNRTLRAGIELGLWTFLGFAFQSIGLETTTASRSAFLLYLNVKFVPFLAYFLFKKTISTATWISASFALFGTFLLANDGALPNIGDAWCIAAAAASAMYILRLDTFSKETDDAAALNSIAFATVASLCGVWCIIDSSTSLSSIVTDVTTPFLSNPLPVIYLGVIATGLCNYLQTLGQRTVPAEKAAIIFSLDPVYSAVFARVLLGEQLGLQGYLGGAAILTGVVITAFDSYRSQAKAVVPEVSTEAQVDEKATLRGLFSGRRKYTVCTTVDVCICISNGTMGCIYTSSY